MDASVELRPSYHTLSSLPEPTSHRSLSTYVRSSPLDCLHSFLSFHHYVVVSYTLILTHFFLLHLSTFFLLLDYVLGSPLPPRPYLIFLSFLAARSILLLVLFTLRLRFPSLWYYSPISAYCRRFVWVLTVTRLLSIAFFVFGSLHWLLLAPHQDETDGHNSFIATSPAVPCLLIRECLALMMPIMAMAYLRVRGRRRAEVSSFIPYLLSSPAPSQWSSPAVDEQHAGKRRGLSLAEIEQLGEERYNTTKRAVDEEAEVCAICLCDFTSGVRVRQLRCCHIFHTACVDTWLQQRGTCPLCVQQCQPTVMCDVAADPLVAENGNADDVEMQDIES